MISVIVPVYKVEKYLRRCVDSILKQTCRDFELLLIDDGSPDGCPQICDEYAALDSRVLAFHKPNGGLSDARNYGLGLWPSLIVNACISFALPNLLFFAVYGRKPLFRESIDQIRRVLLK